jgi:hypothetical protein
MFTSQNKTRSERRFGNVETIKQNTMQQLLLISKTDFGKCFEQWKNHWNKWESQGHYFEGDHSTIAVSLLLQE